MGIILEEATRANGGIPQCSISFDGGTKNASLFKVLLGLKEGSDLSALPFWSKCATLKICLPCFPFEQVRYLNKFIVVGNCGPFHVGKRFTLHAISGIRKVQWGSVAVDFAASLLGGLSLRAFTCSNPQSDLQSSQRLNVIYCQEDWDDFGVRLHATIASLFQSGTVAACGFTLKQQVENLQTCHYIMLLNWMNARVTYMRDWSQHFFPAQTIMGVLGICASGIIASLGDLGYADMRTEIPVERFFGQIKSHFRGTCGVKDKFLVGQECNCVCVCLFVKTMSASDTCPFPLHLQASNSI